MAGNDIAAAVAAARAAHGGAVQEFLDTPQSGATVRPPAPPQMGYGDASNISETVRALRAIQESGGQLRPGEQQALDAAQSQMPQAEQAIGETQAMGRGWLQGATFNLADEISNLPAYLNDDDYAEGLAESRARDAAAQEQYPGQFGSGEFGGAMLTALLPAGWAGRATTLPGQMGRGAVAGAAMGGAAEFGRGEGGDGTTLEQFANRAGPAVPYAAAGGALGGLAPPLAAGTGATLRALMGGAERLPGFSNRAAGVMSRAFRRHEATDPTPVVDYLARLGDEGTLADVPGALQSTAMGTASMPGAGGDTLRMALEARAQGSAGRITDTADEVLGGAGEAAAQRAAQADLRRNVAGPMYERARAYDQPLDVTDLGTRLEAIASNEGPATAAALRRYIPEDAESMTATQLHGYRSDLSDAAQAARQAGNGKQARILEEALREFDTVLDTVPGYTEARNLYAQTFAVEDAVNQGRTALAGGAATSQTPAEISATFRAMSPAQQEAYRQGVREYIYAQMGTARNAPAQAWGDLSRGWTQEKLAIILGPDEAARILDRMNAERVFSETRGRVNSGSDTARRQEAAADLGDIRAPETGQRPGPINAARGAAAQGYNSVLDALLPGRAAGNLDVGRILAMQGPQRDAIIRELLAQAARNPNTTAQRAIMAALRSGLPAAGIAAGQASQER